MNSLDLNKDSMDFKSETVNSSTVQTDNVSDSSSTNLENIDCKAEVSNLTLSFTNSTKSELISALKTLIEKEIETIKDDVESIKQLFYKKLKAEIDEKKKSCTDGGGSEEDFKHERDEDELVFKHLLNQYKTKKATHLAKIEQEKENNLIQKQHILDQMKALVETNDDVSSHVAEFKNLQQKWKAIGPVPQTSATELWKLYNQNQESFWDLIKINNELREYDFRKNLEAKNSLCEQAEKLTQENDVVSAFQKLQNLHEEWHELGPVAKEYRDQIWAKFKDSSSIINKKHQAYFDAIRQTEENNLKVKLELCEKIESIDFTILNSYKGWDEATKQMLSWQEEWKSIGYAPRKQNQKIFERYRSACDKFFDAKGEFYKESKNTLAANADKKRALCDQAESLKNSTDWKETGEKLVALQKEWKTIGPVAKKLSDELWKKFISSCDYFFEQKNKNFSSQRSVENENLQKKKVLIEKISNLNFDEQSGESQAVLKSLIAEWSTIGHVPFKEKDKIYKEFRDTIDKQFDRLHIDSANRRMNNFRNSIKESSNQDENKLYRERSKLVRSYEHLKSEIATCENNIGFFNTSSKKGNGMIKELERKIEGLRDECKLIEQKINLIDENI